MLHGHHPRPHPTHIRQKNCWHTCTWAPQSRPAVCILSLPYQSIVTESSWPKPNWSPTLTGRVIIPHYGMSSQAGQPSSSVVTAPVSYLVSHYRFPQPHPPPWKPHRIVSTRGNALFLPDITTPLLLVPSITSSALVPKNSRYLEREVSKYLPSFHGFLAPPPSNAQMTI